MIHRFFSKGFCSLIFFFISLTAAWAQSLTYDIFHGKDRVGEILVEKKVIGNRIAYEANSQSQFRILFSNELETLLSANFENNELISCASKNTLNGKIRDHATMVKKGNSYHVKKHPDEKKILKEVDPIRMSTVLLYYNEPINISSVYSENYLEHCPIKPLGNSTYELVLPGKKINHYIYKNGKLVEIKVFRTFVDLSFRLSQERS